MDTEKSPEVWHRLSNESGRAYEAFKVYMYLPPAERTVVRAWRAWARNPDAKREPPYFREWAADYAWSERARAHDHRLEVIRESGMEEAIKEEAARQAKQVEQRRFRYNELMAMAYERTMQYLEDDEFAKHLRPSDVVQIIKLHLEDQHKLGGDQSDDPIESTVDWSEDEQRELDALLGEIDAEEAHEEREGGSDRGEEGPEDAGGDQG